MDGSVLQTLQSLHFRLQGRQEWVGKDRQQPDLQPRLEPAIAPVARQQSGHVCVLLWAALAFVEDPWSSEAYKLLAFCQGDKCSCTTRRG